MKKKDKNPDKDKKSASQPSKKQEGDGEAPKKSFLKRIFSPKFLIIFLVIAVIISGAAFAGWFFFLRKNKKSVEQAKTEEAEQKKPEADKANLPPEPAFPEIVELEPFEKIRLQESEAMNMLSFKISVELVKPEMRKSFEGSIPDIRQAIETEAKKMTWLVLRSPEGKLNFKYSLIRDLNGALPSRMIKNIYFTSFILH